MRPTAVEATSGGQDAMNTPTALKSVIVEKLGLGALVSANSKLLFPLPCNPDNDEQWGNNIWLADNTD